MEFAPQRRENLNQTQNQVIYHRPNSEQPFQATTSSRQGTSTSPAAVNLIDQQESSTYDWDGFTQYFQDPPAENPTGFFHSEDHLNY